MKAGCEVMTMGMQKKASRRLSGLGDWPVRWRQQMIQEKLYSVQPWDKWVDGGSNKRENSGKGAGLGDI